jgi:hypothetical protein
MTDQLGGTLILARCTLNRHLHEAGLLGVSIRPYRQFGLVATAAFIRNFMAIKRHIRADEVAELTAYIAGPHGAMIRARCTPSTAAWASEEISGEARLKRDGRAG